MQNRNDAIDLTTMGAKAPIVPELTEPYRFTAATFPDLTMTPEQLSLNYYILSGRMDDMERRLNALEDFIDG